ncbi:MAG TPA: cytochrome c biogenesis protein ResB [Nakamurella sp.]|nr:cytochrome c biogenesis protein ResB [Nakamurella sp.]
MPPRDSVRVRTETRMAADGKVHGGGSGGPASRRPGGPVRAVTAFARTIWRHLTSMRTALILLFLLALASLPGALLPQWDLNTSKTAQYIADHPTLGPLLDRLGFFGVFASPWYSAIYLLLFISLVGCLTPRTFEFIGQWRAKPVSTPRNLARLPHHATVTVDEPPDAAAERIRRALRHKGFGGWRVAVRPERDGVVTVSAERGYLREVGNLVFHFSVLGLLIAVAVGSLFGFAGSVIVTSGGGFCSATPIAYDNFRPGRLVDGTDMAPFCVTVNGFHADYNDDGMAKSFLADVQIQSGAALGSDRWQRTELQVNNPLRIAGQRLYLLGHGYSPTFTVRYPDGQVRDYDAPFQPQDSMFTSQGVIKITDPPGYTGSAVRQHQLAIVGIFAPSGVLNGGVLTSGFPDLLAPAVAVEVYRGDLGMEGGRSQSVFAIDTDQVSLGLLKSQGRANLTPGESMTLSDGTVITFTGAKPWVSLQTSYDPAQGWALVFAILLVAGLLTSLTIKRRRVWYRIRPAASGAGSPGSEPGARPAGGDRTLSPGSADAVRTGAGSVVEIGGLARTDQAGYGAEFSALVAIAGSQDAQAADGRAAGASSADPAEAVAVTMPDGGPDKAKGE